jgi:hypothetical protein
MLIFAEVGKPENPKKTLDKREIENHHREVLELINGKRQIAF